VKNEKEIAKYIDSISFLVGLFDVRINKGKTYANTS